MENSETISVDEPAIAPIRDQTNPPRRILVVEDDSDILSLNVETLKGFGYKVDAAEDGAVAWDALQLNSYDVLVTDHSMPKVSGVELLKKMYAARMVLRVIMATGTLPQEEFIRSPWLQPDATLLKPYTLDELLRAVEEVLRATCDLHEQKRAASSNGQGQPLFNGLRL